jgi:hypothetical protein
MNTRLTRLTLVGGAALLLSVAAVASAQQPPTTLASSTPSSTTSSTTPSTTPTVPHPGPSGFPLVPYLWAVVGVAVSVILPIARRWIFPGQMAAITAGLPPLVKKLLGLAIFSLVGALVVVATAGSSGSAWGFSEAFLAGYTIDSTLQKLTVRFA